MVQDLKFDGRVCKSQIFSHVFIEYVGPNANQTYDNLRLMGPSFSATCSAGQEDRDGDDSSAKTRW